MKSNHHAALEIEIDQQERHIRGLLDAILHPVIRGLHIYENVGIGAEVRLVDARFRIALEIDNGPNGIPQLVSTFPLPIGCAIDEIELEDGIRPHTIVTDRHAARVGFLDARRRRAEVALVSQDAPGIYTLEIANLRPGRSTTIVTSGRWQTGPNPGKTLRCCTVRADASTEIHGLLGRYRTSSRSEAERRQLVSAVVEIGLEQGIVTPWTSILTIDQPLRDSPRVGSLAQPEFLHEGVLR